ncbi:PFD5 protein, partial [Alaudala cheleensis]|nr:PFD5 protein [Alaudala cheleensis]
QEVEFLSSSLAQLKVVQTKFVEAKECLNVLHKGNEGEGGPQNPQILTGGSPKSWGGSPNLDMGAEDARAFFKRKIEFLTRQMEKIQPALQEKHAMKQ